MFSVQLTEDYGYGDGLEKASMKTTSLNGTDNRYGSVIVMIWGGILVCHSGKTELVIVIGRLYARRYCDEIIIPVVIPVLQRGRAYICSKTTLAAMLLVTQCSALLQQSNISPCDQNFN